MKLWYLLAFVPVQDTAPPVPKEVFAEYRVSREGKPLGKAYLKNLRTEEKGFRTILTLVLESPDSKVTIRTDSSFDAVGNPISKTQDLDLHDGKNQARFAAKFASHKAIVKLDSGGKTSEAEYSLEPSLPIADPSVVWFRESAPILGEKRSYYAFHPTELRWSLINIEYAEKKVASFDGRRIEVHLLRSIRNGLVSDSWVEADGTLVKFAGEGITMERIWPKAKSPS